MIVHLYLGSKEPTLGQAHGDGGCDVTRLSFVGDPCYERYYRDLNLAIESYPQDPDSLNESAFFEHWLAYDERSPEDRSDYADIRKENISPISHLIIEFTLKELLETHPWNFNSASDCMCRMYDAQRVVSDCPLLGSPFVRLSPSTPKLRFLIE